MLRPPLAAAIAVALLCAAAGCPGKGAGGAGDGTGPDTASRTPAEVVEAGQRLVESWRQGYEVRSLEALAPLYAQDLDLVLVAQGQVQLGWTAVESYLSAELAAKEIHIRLDDVQVAALGAGAAVVTAMMTRESSDGVASVSERGALTLALRAQTDGRWVIVSEHYSYPRSAP